MQPTNSLECRTVSSPDEVPGSPAPEFHLTQVDPADPIKSGWRTFAVAAVVLIAAVVIFYFIVKKPPQMTGQVLQVNYYPVHTTISGDGSNGMQGSNENYYQLLIFADVKVQNQTNIPLFLQDISATLTTADGTEHENIAAGTSDFDRVFQAYPAAASYRAQPFDRSATIQPGQSIEGLAIFNFPVSQQQWDARKSGNVVVSFVHQNNLLVSFPH